VPLVAQALATAAERSLDDIARITTANAEQLFSQTPASRPVGTFNV